MPRSTWPAPKRCSMSIVGQGARLPSQRRYEARERSKLNGVRIPKALYDDLQALLPRRLKEPS